MSGCEPCGCDPDYVGEQGYDQGKSGWVCARHQEEATLASNVEWARSLKPRAYAEPSIGDPKLKASNPKDAIGSDKLPLHLWPETATVLGALGLLDGTLKYGRSNFRAAGVRASVYYDACRRHINKWFEGEDNDPDSGLPHLSHALACLAIIVDAQAANSLTDDRMLPGGYIEMVDQLTPHVARLKALYADKNPKHYTRADR